MLQQLERLRYSSCTKVVVTELLCRSSTNSCCGPGEVEKSRLISRGWNVVSPLVLYSFLCVSLSTQSDTDCFLDGRPILNKSMIVWFSSKPFDVKLRMKSGTLIGVVVLKTITQQRKEIRHLHRLMDWEQSHSVDWYDPWYRTNRKDILMISLD